MNKIFLDDERSPPDDTWLVFRTAPELIAHLVEVGGSGRTGWDGMTISLDHDLGVCKRCLAEYNGPGIPSTCEHTGTGYDVVVFLEEFFHWAVNQGGFIPDMTLLVHSQNPVGRMRMMQGINNIGRITNGIL